MKAKRASWFEKYNRNGKRKLGISLNNFLMLTPKTHAIRYYFTFSSNTLSLFSKKKEQEIPMIFLLTPSSWFCFHNT